MLSRSKKGVNRFYVSDNPEWFSGLAQRFMGRPVKNVRKV
jgi:glutamate racemase